MKLILIFREYDGTLRKHHIFHNEKDMEAWLGRIGWQNSINDGYGYVIKEQGSDRDYFDFYWGESHL